MQTENSALRGAQAGARGSLTGGGCPGLWPGGVRGKGGGVGGDSSLNTPSSTPLRRDRQSLLYVWTRGDHNPKLSLPALDPLTGRLQPLSPVSVSISGRPDLFKLPFLVGLSFSLCFPEPTLVCCCCLEHLLPLSLTALYRHLTAKQEHFLPW